MCRVLYLILWLYLPIIGYQKLWENMVLFSILWRQEDRVSERLLILTKVRMLPYRAEIQRPTLCSPLEEHLLWDSAAAASISWEVLRSLSRAAVRFSSWAQNISEMSDSVWSRAEAPSITRPSRSSPSFALWQTLSLPYPAGADVVSRAA